MEVATDPPVSMARPSMIIFLILSMRHPKNALWSRVEMQMPGNTQDLLKPSAWQGWGTLGD